MRESIDRARVLGSPHIGTYVVATDEVVIVPKGVEKEFKEKARETLSVVDIVEITIAGTALIGIFSIARSKTILVPDIVREEEVDELRSIGLRVEVLELSSFNALGNIVLHNSRSMCAHPELNKDIVSKIASILGTAYYTVKSIANIPTVGSAAVVTDRGGLAHPSVSDEELKKLSEFFGVEFDVGTVNFGIGFVKSGLVANNYGVLVGELTTGPEIIRITKALRVGE
ncbi:MAG: translation initiation factor IF-6 [Sulfolobales archaeon]|nr:translation initiation factor IF-6 [Sulfolobales archaeon]MDW8082291.1 translation initiation factor IF-6 [Sulfolobales archaeon]